MAVESSLPRPSAWSRLAPTPLAVGEPSPALLVQTRSTTPPALPRPPSVPPWTGRSPSREHRTKTRKDSASTTARADERRGRGRASEEEERDPRGRRARPARVRPLWSGAPPFAPPRSRLHLPSRRFEKPLERGRALAPTASRRASTNRERAAPPLPFTPGAVGDSGGTIRRGN